LKLYDFYGKEEKGDIPYQYLPKNQREFASSTNLICKLLSNVEPVIMDHYERLYKLESITPEQSSMEMPNEAQSGTTVNVQNPPPKESKLKNPFKIFQKRESDSQSPYRLNIDTMQESRKVLEDFYDLIDFHAYGCDWPEFINIGIFKYLSIEITEFKRRTSRIITAINQGHELGLRQEKEMSAKIIAQGMREEERHRQNDFGSPP